MSRGVKLESHELQRTAQRSVDIAAEIDSIRNQANQEMLPVLQAWQGRAKVAAQNAWHELDGHLNKLHRALTNIGNTLHVVHTNYVNRDEDEASEHGKVLSDASTITVSLGPQA